MLSHVKVLSFVIAFLFTTYNISAQEALNLYFLNSDSIQVIFGDDEEFVKAASSPTVGFTLSDGRFITTRSALQPWFFVNKDSMDPGYALLNILASNGGTVNNILSIRRKNKPNVTLKSTNFSIDSSSDEITQIEHKDDETGKVNNYNIRLATWNQRTNWAVCRPGLLNVKATKEIFYKGGFSKTSTLRAAQLDDKNQVYYVDCLLQNENFVSGVLTVSGSGFSQSGAPVQILVNQIWQWVGILSVKAENTGFVIPFSAIDK